MSTPSPHAPPTGFDAAELRVLGCLIEKAVTVPDSYPLTLNALRNACNQSTSRDPVVDYDERTVLRALDGLRARGVTRVLHSRSNRAPKFRHVADEVYGVDAGELALLGVLMLRGPQTVGELKARTARQHEFGDTDAVEAALTALAGRPVPLVVRLERQPGQKDARWVHRLGRPDDAPSSSVVDESSPPVATSPSSETAPVLRVARAVADLTTVAAQYLEGFGWEVLAEWEDHDGFDGMVIGQPNGPYHLEFIHHHDEPDPPSPHHEHLLAVYVAVETEWAERCRSLEAAGFATVVNPNPYWDANGRTFADAEGGRVVVVRGPWTA